MKNKNNIYLWLVLAGCLIYVTLWIAGIRFPPVATPPTVSTCEMEGDEEPDSEVRPIPEPEPQDQISDDDLQPEEIPAIVTTNSDGTLNAPLR